MVGGWGRNETWREFFVRMEKRVERRKELEKIDAEIEKLKAEKKGDQSEETERALNALLTKAKALFVKGDVEETA